MPPWPRALASPQQQLCDPGKLAFYAGQGLTWQDGARIGVTTPGMPLLDALAGRAGPGGTGRRMTRADLLEAWHAPPGARPPPLARTPCAPMSPRPRGCSMQLGDANWAALARIDAAALAQPACHAPRRGIWQCLRRARTVGAESLHRLRPRAGRDGRSRPAPHARAAHQEGPAPPGHARRGGQPGRDGCGGCGRRHGSARATGRCCCCSMARGCGLPRRCR